MDSVVKVRKVMGMQELDMEVVAMIAWGEVAEARLMEVVVGERGGKRRLEGDISDSKSMWDMEDMGEFTYSTKGREIVPRHLMKQETRLVK